MEFLNPQLLALVPVTVGLAEVVKRVGMPTKYIPLSALLIGASLSCFVANSVTEIVLGGVAVGLMASGLYSGTRTMVSL